MRKIRFIINPISGVNRDPRKISQWIERIFEHSEDQYQIVHTTRPGDGTVLSQKAIEDKCDIVAVVGGDGTINEVGRGLCGSETALAVIPAGSGNGFARNFKIPLNQYQAIKLLLSPQIVSVDSGKINDHHFFNVAGFGLDADICQHFEEFGIRGPIPYFLVGTRAFLAFHPDPVQIRLDDKELEFSPLLVSIANAPEYGNGAIIAPSALPDDGYLDVAVLDPMPFWRAVPNLYRLFNGTIDQLPGFHLFKVKKVEIERLNSGAIHTDGNPHQEKSQLKVEVIPNSLNVVAGPGFSPARKLNVIDPAKKS